MKTCTRCGHTKPLTEYHKQAKAPDGHRARCKTCLTREARERWERLTPDQRAAKIKKDREGKRKAREAVRRAAGVAPRRAGCGPRCNYYGGCRRAATVDGLCRTHHDEVTASRESPLALTGGRWVPGVGGVRRWVA